jgi:hypothetical protein
MAKTNDPPITFGEIIDRIEQTAAVPRLDRQTGTVGHGFSWVPTSRMACGFGWSHPKGAVYAKGLTVPP